MAGSGYDATVREKSASTLRFDDRLLRGDRAHASLASKKMTSSPSQPVKAVLGPTNTGKTHLAVERLTAHSSGMIGFPLRLLAREVYDRVARIKGAAQVGLITGEERIMPLDRAVRRSTAKWVLPVLVGPRTALTGWEEEEVIFLSAKLAWVLPPRNRGSSQWRGGPAFFNPARIISRPRHALSQCKLANPPLN